MINDKALFAAGCFWGVEEIFSSIQCVVSTCVGYSGGIKENPTYEEVCSDSTQYAESVLVNYNPKIITYSNLLDYFWNCHDPTSLNKQGKDIGSQYRSAIFYYDNEQKEAVIKSRDEISIKYNKKIVTEISLAKKFFLAEDYHQKYIKKNKAIL